MQRKTIILMSTIAILIISPIAFGEMANSDKQQFGVTQFIQHKWNVVSSLRDVDPAVVQALRLKFGKDDRLANAGEPFNPTDVIDKRPNRRFILAGHSGSKWFIAYERGGYVHFLKLVVFNSSSKPPRMTMSASGVAGTQHFYRRWRLNIDQIKSALSDGKLDIDDEKHLYY